MSHNTAMCTLNDVIKQYDLSDAAATGVSATTQAVITSLETAQLTLLKQLIYDASHEIEHQWGRTFVPFYQVYTVRPSMQAWTNWRYEHGILRYYFQDLHFADLLELDSVEIDDVAVSASYYRLEGEAPYDYLTFDKDNVTLPSASTFSSKVEFAGWWGYHEHPNGEDLWEDSVSMTANITSSQTSFNITAADADLFDTYQYIRIGDEMLFITAVSRQGQTHTLTVERGVRGSTATTHASSDALYRYRQTPDVIMATRRRVINLMQKRAETANLVQIGEGVAEASTESISLHIPPRYVPVKSV